MILTKVITGFVTQRYDTETKQFLDQEFIAGDEVTWERGESGCDVGDELDLSNDEDKILVCGSVNGNEPYLPMTMTQPEKDNNSIGCHICGGPDH